MSLGTFLVLLGVGVILLAFLKKQSDIIHDLRDHIEETQLKYRKEILELKDDLEKEIQVSQRQYKTALLELEKKQSDKLDNITAAIQGSVQNLSKELLQDMRTVDMELYSSLGIAKCLPCSSEDTSCIPCNMTWKDCADVYRSGHTKSGMYRIKAGNLADPVSVYCDESDGGGWTVFQRCQDASVSFERNWQEYKRGFGDLKGTHWLGNDIVSAITTGPVKYTLRVDLMNFENEKTYAEYDSFEVRPETENYKLIIGIYRGTAGDNGKGLSYHNDMEFTTVDVDNDKLTGSCAKQFLGGWWYNECHYVKLTGQYTNKRLKSYQYMNWYEWDQEFSLKFAQMKFRPTYFKLHTTINSIHDGSIN